MINNYTLPASQEEWYITATFVADNGKSVYIEVPGVFDIDGAVDEAACLDKLQQTISAINIRLNRTQDP